MSDILFNLMILIQRLRTDSNTQAPSGPEAFKIKPWFCKP